MRMLAPISIGDDISYLGVIPDRSRISGGVRDLTASATEVGDPSTRW